MKVNTQIITFFNSNLKKNFIFNFFKKKGFYFFNNELEYMKGKLYFKKFKIYILFLNFYLKNIKSNFFINIHGLL